jgi:hypothetical protein
VLGTHLFAQRLSAAAAAYSGTEVFQQCNSDSVRRASRFFCATGHSCPDEPARVRSLTGGRPVRSCCCGSYRPGLRPGLHCCGPSCRVRALKLRCQTELLTLAGARRYWDQCGAQTDVR